MRPGLPSPAARARSSGLGPRVAPCFARWMLLVAALLFAACLPATAANPDRIEIDQATFESRDDGTYFSGDFEIDLKPKVAEALDRGLTLYFVVEVELTRARWYWFDEKAVNTALNYRLSYHALTRQYRVTSGGTQLAFATLAEALEAMSHVHDWKIADRGALKAGAAYAAAVRMRLDTTQLPKPVQINAMTSRDWTLESDWKRSVFETR